MVFSRGLVSFQNPTGREVLHGKSIGGMYLLNELNKPGQLRAMTTRSQIKLANLEVWHQRFGHVSVATIKTALARNLLDSLEVKNILTLSGIYEDCIYSKHAAQPYNATVKPEGAPNNCIYINLWRPASIVSLGGASYMMVAVDGGSLYLSVYFLSRKDATTTLMAFTIYHTESEQQTDKKLWEVQVDAGHE